MKENFYTLSSHALSSALIAVAVSTLLVAFFVRNPYIKAAFLAYEVLP